MEPGLIHVPFNFSGRVDPLETFQSFLEGILEVLVKQCLLTPFPYTHPAFWISQEGAGFQAFHHGDGRCQVEP